MAGHDDAEVEYVRNFNIVLRADRRPYIVAAVMAAFNGFGGHPPNTIASLRGAFLHNLPPLTASMMATAHVSLPTPPAHSPGVLATAMAAFRVMAAHMPVLTTANHQKNSDRAAAIFRRLQTENQALLAANKALKRCFHGERCTAAKPSPCTAATSPEYKNPLHIDVICDDCEEHTADIFKMEVRSRVRQPFALEMDETNVAEQATSPQDPTIVPAESDATEVLPAGAAEGEPLLFKTTNATPHLPTSADDSKPAAAASSSPPFSMFTAGHMLILGQVLLTCCYLLVIFVVPAVSSACLPWTDPAALFAVAGTGYVTTRGGCNWNTVGGIISAIAFLFFVSNSFSGGHAHSLELQLPGGHTVLPQAFLKTPPHPLLTPAAPKSMPTAALPLHQNIYIFLFFVILVNLTCLVFTFIIPAFNDWFWPAAVVTPPILGIRRLATPVATVPGPRRGITFANPPEVQKAQPQCSKCESVDTSQLSTRTGSRNPTAAAGLCAMVLILYLVVCAQAVPDLPSRVHAGMLHNSGANRNINLLLQEVPEPGYPSLPKPEHPPFPGFFAQGGISWFRDRYSTNVYRCHDFLMKIGSWTVMGNSVVAMLPGMVVTISVIFLVLGFLDLAESFGWDVASMFGFKVPPRPDWFLVLMAAFGACLLGLCYL